MLELGEEGVQHWKALKADAHHCEACEEDELHSCACEEEVLSFNPPCLLA